MSTLGRKAMKKTLKRLVKNAIENVMKFYEESAKIDTTKKPAGTLYFLANRAIVSLVEYIMPLEDYSTELDEAWNKLLKQARQPKPKPQKEGKKKPSYRV